MTAQQATPGQPTYRLGMLAGDGIGPEITRAVAAVLAEAGAGRFAWVELPMGLSAIETHNAAMPEATKATLADCHGWIMGPHDSVAYPPEHQARRNPSGELRHHFDLFANIRPAKNYPGVPAMASGTDLIIVRENTEGFYPDRNMYAGAGEYMVTPDVAISVGVFTRKAAERVAHVACELAQQRRGLVTIVHKANVIRFGTGLFRDVCREIAAQYPGVRVDDYHVDAMAALLVRRPESFDVIVTTNMFGDILSDLAVELTGSLGLAPSINAGVDHAMAQAAHGSAPDITGQDIANPVGLLFSTTMLLRWLAQRHRDDSLLTLADRIDGAVLRAWEGGVRTPDLGGDAGTMAFAEAVIMRL